jgi:predicted nuclease of restriction endonuclease-like (RecB) superfamily
MPDRIQPQFTAVLTLIKTAQNRVIATTNQELIQLYWSIGQYISDRLKTSEWGQKTIAQLATFIQTQEPGIKGFEKRNLERMRQFYETYPDFPIASALLTQLSWTHHYILISRCKTQEERLFYLQLAATERYSTRELDRHPPRPRPPPQIPRRHRKTSLRHGKVKEGYLEIREVATGRVVTAIEILSPTNKRAGYGRNTDEAKRQKLLASQSHLIEIDLLRSGKPMELLNTPTKTDYRILVSRSEERPQARLHGFNRSQPIPPIVVPLEPGDAEPILDLQAILNEIYDQAGFDLTLEP